MSLMESKDRRPHVVIMGNSLDGPTSAYTSLILSASRDAGKKVFPHAIDCATGCSSNEHHISQFMAANHDQLILSYFAIHGSYPFELRDGADEKAFVDGCVSSWAHTRRGSAMAQNLLPRWRADARVSDSVGAGITNMDTFMLQHVFTEFRGVLGHLLARSLLKADLLPVNAQFGGEETAN